MALISPVQGGCLEQNLGLTQSSVQHGTERGVVAQDQCHRWRASPHYAVTTYYQPGPLQHLNINRIDITYLCNAIWKKSQGPWFPLQLAAYRQQMQQTKTTHSGKMHAWHVIVMENKNCKHEVHSSHVYLCFCVHGSIYTR